MIPYRTNVSGRYTIEIPREPDPEPFHIDATSSRTAAEDAALAFIVKQPLLQQHLAVEVRVWNCRGYETKWRYYPLTRDLIPIRRFV